jgi:threonine dehydratase
MTRTGHAALGLGSIFSLKQLFSNPKVVESQGEVNRERKGIDSYVGNTPLVYLKTLSAHTGCHIYGKCEYMNPTGSVKGLK